MTIPQISSRVENIKPSATLEIDSLAKSLKSQGKNVISFAAGEPDFAPPAVALSAGTQLLTCEYIHKYSDVAGLLPLREEIARKTTQNYANSTFNFTADNVIVTNGGKEAVFLTIAALINEGDGVLLPTPAWLTYDEVIRFFGGVVQEIKCNSETEFKVTTQMLEDAITDKTKVLLLNTPCNPTGQVYTQQELKSIGQWAKNAGITVISDEIYDNLVYEANKSDFTTAPHILDCCPELRDQIIIINGVAKSYSMTGWRVGWITANERVCKAVKKLKGHLSSNTNNLAQAIALNALQNADNDVVEMRKAFNRRRLLIIDLLHQISTPDGSKLQFIIPKGAFYIFCDVSNLLNKPLGNNCQIAKTAAELAKIVLEQTNVAVVPMESFGVENHIRFSYALSDEEITKGITRLIDFFAINTFANNSQTS